MSDECARSTRPQGAELARAPIGRHVDAQRLFREKRRMLRVGIYGEITGRV
jgi:hypothetical protein